MPPARFAAICAEVGIKDRAQVDELFDKVRCATVHFHASLHVEQTRPSTNEVRATFDTMIELCDRLHALSDGMDGISYQHFWKAAEDLQWAALNDDGDTATEMRRIGALEDAHPEGLAFMTRREVWTGIRYLRFVAMRARERVTDRQAGRRSFTAVQYWVECVSRACASIPNHRRQTSNRMPIEIKRLKHFLELLMKEISAGQTQHIQTAVRRYRMRIKRSPSA